MHIYYKITLRAFNRFSKQWNKAQIEITKSPMDFPDNVVSKNIFVSFQCRDANIGVCLRCGKILH